MRPNGLVGGPAGRPFLLQDGPRARYIAPSMPLSKTQTPAQRDIPQDVDGLLRLAAQSMFDVLARSAEGMMVVDRDHRVVWISEGYKRFLPALGFNDEHEFVGKRVEDVVPNTQMLQVLETGKPVLVDLLTNKAGTFLVSRLPLRNEAGEVIGALGLVLLDHPETTMQPLIQKFGRLQQELEDTRNTLLKTKTQWTSQKRRKQSGKGENPKEKAGRTI